MLDKLTKHIAAFGSLLAGILCYFILFFKSSSIATFLCDWPKNQILSPPENLKKRLLLFTIASIFWLVLWIIIPIVFFYIFYFGSSEVLSAILQSMIASVSITTIFMSLIFTTLFHSCFCILIYDTYQKMSKEIHNIQQGRFSHHKYQPIFFDQYRIQHQKLVAGAGRFMSIFGGIEFIIFLDIVVLVAFVVYQMVYSLSAVGKEFDVITFIQLFLLLLGKTTPLLAFCISSDLAVNKVG